MIHQAAVKVNGENQTKIVVSQSKQEFFAKKTGVQNPKRRKKPEPEAFSLESEIISDSIDVINFLLTEMDAPKRVRHFINALVGFSEGRTEFEADDYKLGSRIRGSKAGRANEDTIKKHAQRARNDLWAWQKESGYYLAIWESGGKQGTTLFKSRYTLPLIEAAEMVYNSIRNHADNKNADIYIREISGIAINEFLKKSAKIGKRAKQKSTAPEATLNRYLSTIKTLAKKSAAIAKSNKNFKVPPLDEIIEILENIEKEAKTPAKVGGHFYPPADNVHTKRIIHMDKNRKSTSKDEITVEGNHVTLNTVD